MIHDWKKYLIALAITVAIFATALGTSMLLNNKRVDELRSIQDSIAINILSSETQFNLLKDANCDDLFGSAIGEELGRLADRLSYMESSGRGNNPELLTLKRYYSLLEIKDYLLVSGAAQKCPNRPITILYFYSEDCDDCLKQGEVLTFLRQHNIGILRVYTFDADLDVSAVRTLSNIHKVGEEFPVLVIKGTTYKGFQSIESIQKILPKIATTTPPTGTSTSPRK